MARYHEIERIKEKEEKCSCGKGFKITYKIISESDDTENEHIDYITEINCPFCNKK